MTMIRELLPLTLWILLVCHANAFGIPRRYETFSLRTPTLLGAKVADSTSDHSGEQASSDFENEVNKEEIGNLVADEEWEGLSMELTDLVRMAAVEQVKETTRDFIGKDEYKIGDISKELDARIKRNVATFRDKDEYELGDLTMALDEACKDFVCSLTGKDEYEAGDLSIELDQRVKRTVANYCGKDEYEFGDLSREVSRRVQTRVAEFTGKDEYSFGDVSREIENRRQQWVKDYLGEDEAEFYQFGDITKKAVSNFTGKDEYQFGDVTKKLWDNLFGGRNKKD